MKKILIFTLYDDKAASTRHRFLQFSKDLKNNQYELIIQPLLCNNYLIKKFNNEHISFFYFFKRLFLRLYFLFFQYKYDLIIIHCELLPFFPYFIEKTLLWKKYAYDFDDAFFLRYKKFNNLIYFIFKNKFKKIIKRSLFINAGSSYLYKYAYKYNCQTFLIPTSVDTNRYHKINKVKNDIFTIGWIGSPSSEIYLKLIIDAINKLTKILDFKFLIIGGNKKVLFDNVKTEHIDWNYDDEIKIINQFDVGIMPLYDTPWEQGKCSFKLIQYMACEIPVIASPIGFNLNVVDDNKNGYFANNTEEWVNKILLLSTSEEKRKQMGIEGRKKIKNFYSKDKIFLQLLNNISKNKID